MATAWDTTGDEIQTWSQRVDAFSKLPDLVRRLLLATTPLGTLDMRADGGVWLSGWDGIVVAHHGTTFCPHGASVWELTTRKATRTKLDQDFTKRKGEAPGGVVSHDVAYVVVTAQRFEDKVAWAAERTKEGAFKSVRVVDADDLATWLAQAPAVARWFGGMIGKPASDLFDLEGFAAEWRARTSPSLPFELLLAGREREKAAELVRAWPGGPRPSPLFVRADTKDEAIAFVAAALNLAPGPEREQLRARTLIAESRDALRWAQRGGIGEPALILPHYDDFEPRDAVRHSWVVVPLDGRTAPGQNEIRLGPLPHRRIAEALVHAGIPETEAKNRAEASGGKLASLQRLYGYIAPPAWADRVDRTLLAALLLVGAWQPDNEADREVVRALGVDPGEVRELCEDLSLVADAATVKDVEHWGQATWTFRAPGDMWQALAGGIPGEVLQRFPSAAVGVLGKEDPRYELTPDERFAAAVHGKVLKESSALREGMSRSLARLAQSDRQLDALHGPSAGSRVAQRVVWQVLEPAWIRWASVSNVLPLLAEAAPAAFLDRLEESLAKGDEGVEHLLAEEGQFGSPHTGLLWALETLGWSAAMMPRVARALARLAKRDKELERQGRLANRPERSLANLFHFSLAQTAAPLVQRIAELKQLLGAKSSSDSAFRIIIAELTSMGEGGIVFPARRPDILPLSIPSDEDQQERLEHEGAAMCQALVDMAIGYAGVIAERWRDLLDASYHMPEDLEIQVLRHFGEVRSRVRDGDAAIWATLRRHVHLYEQASNLHERETYKRVRELFETLQPDDFVLRYGYLFEPYVELPEPEPDDEGERRAMVQKRRDDAVQHIWQLPNRWDVLRRLTEYLQPYKVWHLGWTLGGAPFGPELAARLLAEPIDPAYEALIPSYVAGYRESGRELDLKLVVDLLIKNNRLDTALAVIRTQGSAKLVWEALDRVGDPLRSTYWKTTQIVHDLAPDDWPPALKNLIDADNISGAALLLDQARDHIPQATTIEFLKTLAADPERFKLALGANMGAYRLERVIGRLKDVPDASLDTIASLEIMLELSSGSHRRPHKYVSAAISRSPEFFVDLIKQLYRKEGEPASAAESAEDAAPRRDLAHTAYRILHAWRGYPGEGASPEDRERLLYDWALFVLRHSAQEERGRVGAGEVGKVLARAPHAEDGHWPCFAARKLLQLDEFPGLRTALHIAKRNLRGTTGRSLGEGGKQERKLADQFRASANAVRVDWSAAASLLDDLRESYEHEADRVDADAAATLRRAGAEPEDFEPPRNSPPPPSPRTAIVAEGITQINSVALQNLCAFDKLELALTPPEENKGQWIVLLGENGTGKTSLLRGLALAVGGQNIAQDALGKVPAGLVRQHETEAVCIVDSPGVTYSMTIGALPREHVERFGPNGGTPRPLLFGYGCRRGSALGGQEPTRVEAQSSDVATLFDEKERVLPTRGWLKDLGALAGDRAKDRDRVHDNVYNLVRAKLAALLPDEKTRIDVDASEVWVTSGDVGGRVPLAALSDGYLTTLGWAADLVQRWLSWAERRGVTPAGDFFAEQMTGLVLLDEVDLHLHPAWQREIIAKIRNVFPKMSFVVTTHNPLTLLGARANEIWILHRDEGRIVAEQGRESPALMTSSQLFAAYFGITSLYPELGEKLRRYGFLAGTPARTEAEEREVHALLAELRARAVDPGWEPVPREEPPPFADGAGS